MLKHVLITEQSQNNPSTASDGRSAVDKNFCHHRQGLTSPYRNLDPKLGQAKFSTSPVTQWNNPCNRIAIIVKVKMKDLRSAFFDRDSEKCPSKIQGRSSVELRVEERQDPLIGPVLSHLLAMVFIIDGDFNLPLLTFILTRKIASEEI
jgi:hypothetical protein